MSSTYIGIHSVNPFTVGGDDTTDSNPSIIEYDSLESTDLASKILPRLFNIPSYDKSGIIPNVINKSESYKKVKVNNVRMDPYQSNFDNLLLIQNIHAQEGRIYCLKFSHDGKYVCTAGTDKIVYIWEIKSNRGNIKVGNSGSSISGSSDAREKSEDIDDDFQSSISSESNKLRDNEDDDSLTCSINVFIDPKPYRKFIGHDDIIIDIAWSKLKLNFIISASIDTTVRLWHVDSKDNSCLRVFKHEFAPTVIDFLTENIFISGCMDHKIRIWDISVPNNDEEDIKGIGIDGGKEITAVSSIPLMGSCKVIIGLSDGDIKVYDYSKSQGDKGKLNEDQARGTVACRNKNGRFSNGTKVTGIITKEVKGRMNSTNNRNEQQFQLYVTTNDNRIRKIEDRSVIKKYKGLQNESWQIKASISDCGKYIICGSDNGKVHIWNSENKTKVSWFQSYFISDKKAERNESYEWFDCSGTDKTPVSVALFAPSITIKDLIDSSNEIAPKDIKIANESDLELGSRLIITADFEGIIKVYLNLKRNA